MEEQSTGRCGSDQLETHDILLGECKWGADRVDRQVARELIENKAPLVLKELPERSEEWRAHYALFARAGFTPAATAEIQKVQGILVDLKQIDAVLGRRSPNGYYLVVVSTV